MDDWNLIWVPNADGMRFEDSAGPLPAAEVIALSKDPNPIIRQLAQEVLSHRWDSCERDQGGD